MDSNNDNDGDNGKDSYQHLLSVYCVSGTSWAQPISLNPQKPHQVGIIFINDETKD